MLWKLKGGRAKERWQRAWVLAWGSEVLGASQQQRICLQCKRCWFDPWVGKIPWMRAWQPSPVFLSGESHGCNSLAGYSLQGCKESDTTKATEHTRMHFEVSWRQRTGTSAGSEI